MLPEVKPVAPFKEVEILRATGATLRELELKRSVVGGLTGTFRPAQYSEVTAKRAVAWLQLLARSIDAAEDQETVDAF
jgi:hypothetical protein